MTQYIDKDTLVAEIERRIKKSRDNANTAKSNNNHSVTCVWSGHEKECNELISFINTLEVKEVDLDEAARKWEDKVYLEKGWQDEYGTPHTPFHEIGDAFIAGAEFMIKAQKGE